MKSIFKKTVIVFAVAVGLIACEAEFNSLGSDFINSNLEIKEDTFKAVAYSTGLNAVQTNRFTGQPFGVYDDPVYGKSTYDFVTQVSIATGAPTFGDMVEINEVVLSIPYFSTITGRDGETTTYSLDSIYNIGSNALKIYENGFFLNNFDNTDVTQDAVFFSDLKPSIESNRGALIFEDNDFVPLADEIEITSINDEGNSVVDSRSVPAYRKVIASPVSADPNIIANLTYWQNKIIDREGSPELSSISSFQNFFRGLYFKVDPTFSQTLSYFNFQNANITIFYTSLITDINDLDQDGDRTDQFELDSSFVISLTGNRVTLITNDFNAPILSALQSGGNQTTGDESIYLKGGPGSVGFVKLFDDTELAEFQQRNVLINDATLTFYVDQSKVTAGLNEPERIIIYDADNNLVLADYIFGDVGAAINSNLSHLGRLEREDSSDLSSPGVRYTLRLPAHITEVISGVKENVTLGIAVTQNVNTLGPGSRVKNDNMGNAQPINRILLGSAISHEGTVLHGSNSSDVSKRPVFKIFFTELNN